MEPDDKAWLRALPLLLTGGILFSAGALIFWNKGDTTASIAAMTVGVVLTSMWSVTAVADWWESHRRRKQQQHEEEGS
jgi:predicted membrane protein